jgi:hypothetical protein
VPSVAGRVGATLAVDDGGGADLVGVGELVAFSDGLGDAERVGTLGVLAVVTGVGFGVPGAPRWDEWAATVTTETMITMATAAAMSGIHARSPRRLGGSAWRRAASIARSSAPVGTVKDRATRDIS